MITRHQGFGALILTFAIPGILFASGIVLASDFAPIFSPTLQAVRINDHITIDGQLDEPAWARAAVAGNFSEYSPSNLARPPVESKALLMYDEANLYVALVAYDNPEEIRASLRQRDNIFRDDYFGILLDTYGDQSWGYEIFVNPLGIQGDLRQLGDGSEEMSFNIIFESVGQVTDSGYQVELAIPFASLRFPNTQAQAWRVNFWRDRQRDHRYQYTWAAETFDDPCFMCGWGHLTGIENIKPSTNLEFLPTAIGYQSGNLENLDNPRSGFENTNPDGEFSLGVRYGITSSSSAELAFNPDFSQVESDAGQIDVNTTFGLYFSEQRPFFQEGSDLFSTPIDAVYTRTINDPDVAGKFTGQFGPYSMAYLAAYDQNTPIVIPQAQRSNSTQADEAIINIVRARRSFHEDSYLGIMATDRRILDYTSDGIDVEGGSGSTYGIDGAFRFLKQYRFRFQVLGSHTEEPGAGKPDSMNLVGGETTFDHDRYTVDLDGESFDGFGTYVGINRSARLWSFSLSYWERTPTFRTDNGFTTRNDIRELEGWTALDFHANKKWLVEWQPFVAFGRIWDHSGKINLDPGSFSTGTRDEWISPEVMFIFSGQTVFEISGVISRERFAGKVFPGIRRMAFAASSRFSEYINVDGEFLFGNIIYRNPDDPELGKTVQYGLTVDLKPTQRLYVSTGFEHARMDHRDSYFETHPAGDKEIFSGYILRSRLTYQFTREWNLRLVVQYNDFDDNFDFEPLLSWQLNPFTVFYAGMNSRYQYYNVDNYDVDERLFDKSEWELSSRQFFAKFQYLFRI